jgi:hypothetical protein
VTVNVAKLWDNPSFKPMRDWLVAQKVGPTDDVFGVPAADLDRLTMFMVMPTKRPLPVMLVTTRTAYNEAKVLKSLKVDVDGSEARRVGRAVRLSGGEFKMVILADDHTLMFFPDLYDSDLELAELLGQFVAKKTDGPLAGPLADAVKHDFAAAFDMRPLVAQLRGADLRELAPYQALLKTRTVTFAGNFGKSASLSLKLALPDAEAAKRAAPVLKEAADEVAKFFDPTCSRPPMCPIRTWSPSSSRRCPSRIRRA